MSDGPSKVVPEAEPLDDIILGEDDNTATAPPPPHRKIFFKSLRGQKI